MSSLVKQIRQISLTAPLKSFIWISQKFAQKRKTHLNIYSSGVISKMYEKSR